MYVHSNDEEGNLRKYRLTKAFNFNLMVELLLFEHQYQDLLSPLSISTDIVLKGRLSPFILTLSKEDLTHYFMI